MNKFILLTSAMFLFNTISESWADVISEQKCGDECYWKIDGDTLTITGNGKMSDYGQDDNKAPWRNAENFAQVKNVVIDGLTSVGSYAFWGTSITKLTMSDTVTDIGGAAFAWSESLTDIKLSDNLKNLGASAFRGIRLPEITLPADVSIGVDALGPYKPSIICKGNSEECKKLYEQLKNYEYHDAKFSPIPQDLSSKMKKIGQSQCESTNYYWSGTDCNNKKDGINCAENWKQNEDFCNRIQYTPAEAAKVLRDDNNNSVTITFKK